MASWMRAVLGKERTMRVVVNEFISLDGVVQAPGGKEEDTEGGRVGRRGGGRFAGSRQQGGWSGTSTSAWMASCRHPVARRRTQRAASLTAAGPCPTSILR